MANVELLNAARAALDRLRPGREVAVVAPLGCGHINDTLLVTFAAGDLRHAVLQRLNHQVFPEPGMVMANLALLADHMDRVRRRDAAAWPADWQVVRPLPAEGGVPYFIDGAGQFWRLLRYVAGAVELEKLSTPAQAREAGRALGVFHRLTADLDPDKLCDTLPGFHHTPSYLAAYDRLPRRGPDSPEEAACRQVIETHRELAPVLETAADRGELRRRVIHGDPRLANMLFDRESGRAVALIDLDTVKPGLLHYDLGDCLRSCCNPAGDDPASLEEAGFELEVCRGLLGGYLAESGGTLSPVDYELIYPALRLLAFELGLRFFSDHLAGDVYFRTIRPGQNLHRAQVQFRLLAGIEAQEQQIRRLVEESRSQSKI